MLSFISLLLAHFSDSDGVIFCFEPDHAEHITTLRAIIVALLGERDVCVDLSTDLLKNIPHSPVFAVVLNELTTLI